MVNLIKNLPFSLLELIGNNKDGFMVVLSSKQTGNKKRFFFSEQEKAQRLFNILSV